MKEKIHPHALVGLLMILCSISNGQNVGIGTATPTEKLEIDGNLRVDTLKPNALLLAPNAGSGKILTSDDFGNATWENSSYAPPPEDNVGYGVWGDCATNGNISAYNPVADEEGELGDNFGNSVSISGNFAIVGAYIDDGIDGVNQGSVSFYQYDGSTWVFMEKIVDADGEANDLFGITVGISGNYAIVGASGDDGPAGADQGSVCVYQFDGVSWVFMEKIVDADGTESDYFGRSVSIYENYAVVGSPYGDGPAGADQGSVSIYYFDGSNWLFLEKVFDPDGATVDLFGYSLSISGNYLIAGAYLDDVAAGLNHGSAVIYQFDGSNWTFMQKLTDITGAGLDNFGSSVAISGNYAIVGAPLDDNGSAENQGSVSFFQFDGSSWLLMHKHIDANGSAFDNFGVSVSISDNYAFVGAQYVDEPIYNQGSAHIFIRLGNRWQKFQDVIDPSGNESDNFGRATALDASTKRFMIGATQYGDGMGKVVFGKIN